MNSIATMTIGMRASPSISALLAGVEAGLQRFELGLDLLLVAKLGNLFLEALRRRAERERVGAALGEIGMALEHVEAREGLVDLGAGIDFAHAGALVGALHPGLDRVLAGARLAKLALQLGDVGLRRAKRVVEHLDLGLETVAHVGRLLLLDQSGLGEIL